MKTRRRTTITALALFVTCRVADDPARAGEAPTARLSVASAAAAAATAQFDARHAYAPPEEAAPAAAATTAQRVVRPARARAATPEVERGRYLVTIGGCHDCHTPLAMGPDGPVPDMTRALSGHPAQLELPSPPALPAGPWRVTVAATNTAWAGPWGVSFTANLTPDLGTGLGAWTEQNFIDTMRTGRHLGVGRPLLPPTPGATYANMTDEDLGAIYAYLRTIPAIANAVPPPVPPPTAVTAEPPPTQLSRR